ncbi:MAG TPA: hypothetical protein VNM22_21085 [Candidatus Limnocylindrales bacterium]|nr:hypothetical protein [Candidatus Limnocylindrales bacterium]
MATHYNPNNPNYPDYPREEKPGGNMENLKERVGEQVTKMKDQVQEGYEAGKARVGEMIEGVKRNLPEVNINRWNLESLYRDTLDYVQANPDKALFMSLAAGFILGSLFRRK